MLPHTKGEEVTEKRVEPTCTEAGSATYICKVCKQEFTETLKALGHTKGEELTEKRVEPTCTEEGSATYICSVCEKEFTVPLEKIPTPGATIKTTTSPAARIRRSRSTAPCAVPAMRILKRKPAAPCGRSTSSPTMKRQMV